ncbi:MAG: cob(I)yrinic acid a,c-diamide adenosyltransferase [Planctomycetota bacterium]|nr:cob(I)yrinic acid a,c-diamide adenosyltransferase [Planctomycetota bacterium]
MGSISTGGGDTGDTGVLGSGRFDKCHPRIEAYGAVDELNSEIGVCLSTQGPESTAGASTTIQSQLEEIQSILFSLGADLAQPGCGIEEGTTLRVAAPQIDRITAWIHRWEQELPPLKEFIIPGGHITAAQLHRARTICRRAERRTVEFSRSSGEGQQAIVFLNRISDLLFLQARAANQAAAIADVPWKPTDSE